MVSLIPLIIRYPRLWPATSSGAGRSYFNLFVLRLEKVEKEEKVASLEVENQRRPHNPDLHVQVFR